MITTQLLTDLATGTITFNHFARETASDFHRLAQHILTKWGGGSIVDADDLAQEMLLVAHQVVPSHSPARGPIKKYVLFHVCKAAKRELKRQSLRQDTPVFGEALESFCEAQEPRQEAIRLARELTELVPASPLQRAVMSSLAATGSLDITAQDLLSHPDTAVMFKGGPSTARQTVYNSARWMARRSRSMTA